MVLLVALLGEGAAFLLACIAHRLDDGRDFKPRQRRVNRAFAKQNAFAADLRKGDDAPALPLADCAR